MRIEPLLEAARENYLAAYRSAIQRYRDTFQPSADEVLLEVDRNAPQIYRYYRIDLASGAVDPPNFTECNTDSHVDFATTRIEGDGCVLILSPIVWNALEFCVEPDLQDDTPLQA